MSKHKSKKTKEQRQKEQEQRRLANEARKQAELEKQRERERKAKEALLAKQVRVLGALQQHYNNHIAIKSLSNVSLSKKTKSIVCLYHTDDKRTITMDGVGNDEQLIINEFIKAIDKGIKDYKSELTMGKAKELFDTCFTEKDLESKMNEKMKGMKVSVNGNTFTLSVPSYNFKIDLNTANFINYKKVVKVKNDEHKFCKEVSFKKTKEDTIEELAENTIVSIKKKTYPIDKVQKIDEAAEKVYVEYNGMVEDKLDTKRYTLSSFTYKLCLANISVHARNREMDVVLLDGKTEITLRNQFEKDMELVKSDKYKQAKIYLDKLLTEKHDYTIGEFYCLGCFSEYTGFQAYKDDVRTYVKVFDTCKENEEMDVWYARVCSEFEKQVNAHVGKVREERERAYIKTKKYRESFLARDIVDFINRNSQYITEKAVIQYMRGNKVQLNTTIEDISGFVPYKNYEEHEIQNMLYRLINDDIIEERAYRGTFTTFYTLRPYGSDYNLVLENVKEEEIDCEPFSKQTFNDFEAEKIFFDYEKKINLTMKDYMMLLNLTSAKGFFIRYYDEYVCLMQSAPKEFKAYVKMKIDTEDNAFMKKFLKEIVKKSKNI